MASFKGHDILLVAGGRGLITLRSLLLTILANRQHFGRLQLLYGANRFEAFLFRADLEKWQGSTEIDCRYIVQETAPGWYGLVGDITMLLRDLDLQPERTWAAVSGPAGMYRFTNPMLLRLGFQEQQLFLNLERHMKCGLGKCGRCQINDVRVCECGPIFSYDRVRHLREAIER
jgi:NAD(P)H-flavin reductase